MSQMDAPRIDFQAEKAELEAVLASRIFARAPSLSRILNYVCQRYFEGDTDNIKEYNIAVEALGRGTEFQPSTDSIVRVEFSRLRKRLQEYYQTEGKERKIELQLAPSGYTPRFVPREQAGAVPAGSGIEPASHSSGPEDAHALLPNGEEPVYRSTGAFRLFSKFSPVYRLAALGLILLSGLAAGVILLFVGGKEVGTVAAGRSGAPVGSREDAPPSNAAVSSAPAHGPDQGIRIAVGSALPKYVDVSGQTWIGDRWFEGGTAIERADRRVLGTLDSHLYQTARQGRFQYKIPLAAGIYELRLHFAEIIWGQSNPESSGDGLRRFDITLNGNLLYNGLDIVSDAGGPNLVDEKVFVGVSPAEDGFLHLGFSPFRDVALLSGIEILPANGNKMRPVRIVTDTRFHFDSNQIFWSADRYFRGGSIARRWAPVQAADPGLYSSERWGNFTYVIPVAKGRYNLTLKFVESYFVQPDLPPGSRLFDVYCNGVSLLRNFDILSEAGKPNFAFDKVFKGLTPNAQDKLVVSFVPVRDYAIVNAIEVVPE